MIREDSINAAFQPRQDNVVDLASSEKAGRRRLVEQLFNEHAVALRLFLKGRLIPAGDIEDLVQELFSRLLGVDGLEAKMSASTGSNRSYLLTMANNMVVDTQRKSTVRKAYSIGQGALDSEQVDRRTPEQIVAAQMELEAIKGVIVKMRPNWRQAFVLHRFRNMSYEDIALHMGMTVKQVEHCIAQAMRRIRKAREKIARAGERAC